jgi:asparagine synthase (glutamine-hydrolysing)
MAWGLEGRDPLLDHKIIEYAASLPLGYKFHKGVTKYLLRRILYKYVPPEYLNRPKQGFSVPLEKWLRGELRYLLDEYLSESRIKQGGIFNWEIIKSEKEKFLQNKIDYSDHLWLLIVFEMWREKWYY